MLSPISARISLPEKTYQPNYSMELSERCIQILEKEGWPHIYEWSDSPGAVYPEHSHQDKVVIFITEGSLSMRMQGETKELKAGDRLNIPPDTLHSATVGQQGCQFVVGEMVAGDS